MRKGLQACGRGRQGVSHGVLRRRDLCRPEAIETSVQIIDRCWPGGFRRKEDLLEIQVWYFFINDSLGEIDSVAMRFILRWVIGANWERTGIDDAITFPRYSDMRFPLSSMDEPERE